MRKDYQNETKNRLNKKIHILDEGQLERLIYIYLKRWGVIARSLLEKEFGTTLERAPYSA